MKILKEDGMKQHEFDNILHEKLKQLHLTAEQKQEITEILTTKEIKNEIYSVLKFEKAFSKESLILSFLLIIARFLIYWPTIKKVNNGEKMSVLSFS
jgi:hypothetical protein